MDLSGLLGVIIVLSIIGVALWLLETKVPMDNTIKVVIQVIVVISVILWLLNLIGIAPRFH
jgi:hypothetical protein